MQKQCAALRRWCGSIKVAPHLLPTLVPSFVSILSHANHGTLFSTFFRMNIWNYVWICNIYLWDKRKTGLLKIVYLLLIPLRFEYYLQWSQYMCCRIHLRFPPNIHPPEFLKISVNMGCPEMICPFLRKYIHQCVFFAIRFLPIVLASFVKSIWSSESPGILPQKPSFFFPNGMEPWNLTLLDFSSFKYGRYLSIQFWHIKSDYKNKQTKIIIGLYCDVTNFTFHPSYNLSSLSLQDQWIWYHYVLQLRCIYSNNSLNIKQ